MKILTKNYVDENSDGWAEYALISIDDDFKKEILQGKELFQMVKSKNDSLVNMEFWDGGATYFACDHDALTEEQHAELENKNFIVMPDDTDLSSFDTGDEDGEVYGAAASDTEIDVLVISSTGFYWRAAHPHASDAVETPEIPYELLLK